MKPPLGGPALQVPTFLVILLSAILAASAGAADLLLAGKKLDLRQKRLSVVSHDPAIGLGAGEGSADDPTLHGGTLRVLSIEGDVFDTTYPLPAAGWRALQRGDVTVGWAFEGDGPIRAVVVRAGKKLRARGSGVVGHTLAASPEPVRVILTLGGQQYCMSFGGTVDAKPGVKYVAKDAAAPNTCPLPFGDDRYWACRPGKTGNPCLERDLDATVINPDLSMVTEPHTGSADHPFDCFYVYPTVDLTGPPGNHLDVLDSTYGAFVEDPVLAQAARFNDQCRLFAPHYRQVKFVRDASAPIYAEFAYRDVLDAWRLYLKYDNGGRDVVIMGHSQGTGMLTRLMREEVDPDATLRSKLIVALLLGGSIAVPPGGTVGGSFQNIPLCTSVPEIGCVIAYRSYAEGFPPANGSNNNVPAGFDGACTNPAALGGGEGTFAKTYFPTHTNQPLFNIAPDAGLPTPFALFPAFYAGECVQDDTGHSYLEIRVRPGPGDLRTNPIPFANGVLSPAILGTHILDYSWSMGELQALVAAKAAAMP